MNWGRGLLRVWLFLTVLWYVSVTVYSQDVWENYKNPWPTIWYLDEHLAAAEAAGDKRRKLELYDAWDRREQVAWARVRGRLLTASLPPLATLVFGLVIGWIVRGFGFVIGWVGRGFRRRD